MHFYSGFIMVLIYLADHVAILSLTCAIFIKTFNHGLDILVFFN